MTFSEHSIEKSISKIVVLTSKWIYGIKIKKNVPLNICHPSEGHLYLFALNNDNFKNY